MLVFSFPRLSGFFSVNNKNQVVRWLIAQRTILKTRAVKEQIPYVLRVDISNDRLQTLPMPGTNPAGDANISTGKKPGSGNAGRQSYTCGNDLDITAVVFPDNDAIVSEAVDIVFFEKGYCQQAIIQMKDGEDRFSVHIEPFLPRVVVYEGYVKFGQLWKELS